MESNKPRVTFLISVYNGNEHQLRKAIESVINQTYDNYEILIIDDGATDNSIKIIESYKCDKIKIIHNEKNLGLEKSLNKGLEYIDTPYIARMDTDDISHQDRLEKQVEFAEMHPEYAIIASKVNIFDDNGIYGCSNIEGVIKDKDLLFGTPFVHPSMLIRTKDIKEIGGYPLFHRCEDYAMVMKMYSNGKKGYIMPEILLDYRMDKNGYNKRKIKDRFIECKVRKEFFKQMDIPWYRRYYIWKPILVAIIPKKAMICYHKNKFKKEVKK